MPASQIVKPFVATLAAAALFAAVQPLFAQDEPEQLGGKLDFRPAKKLPVKTDDGSAERAIAGFKVAPGLKVKLWAAEPMLSNPNSLSVDEKGVVYVSEANRFKGGVIDVRSAMNWLEEDIASKSVADRVAMVKRHANEKPGKEAIESTDAERIMRIEDTTGSGVANKFSVFSEGYNRIEDGLASGVFAYHGKVYATIIPNLYQLQDTTGEGKADVRKVLSTGYGIRYAYLGHDLHGMVVGPDQRLYYSIGDRAANATAIDGSSVVATETGSVFRCDLDGKNLELFATGLRNPQELRFDDQGNLFTGDNNPDKGDPARWVYVVEGGDSGWRVGYQHGEKPRDGGPWIAEQIFQVEQFNNANYIVPHVAHAGAGPSGLEHYSGVGLPAKYANMFFMCDYRGAAATSGIWAFKNKPKGASFELTNVDDKPIDRTTKIQDASIFYGTGVVDCEQGPDGSLYVADWTQGWDRPFKGRVYRIVDETQATGPTTAPDATKPKELVTLSDQTKQLIGEGMDQRDVRALAKLLSHADQRVRREAQFALAAKGSDAVLVLTAEAEAGMSPLGRLHGIWGLGQVMRASGKDRDAIGRTLVELLGAKDLEVRCQAARMLGDARHAQAFDALLRLAADPEPRARYFAVGALAKIGKREAVPTLVAILRENADKDGVLRFGTVAALAKCADEPTLVKATADESASVRLGAVLALRKMNSPAVAKFLKDADRVVVLEAARAIHDLPIEAALPELAALADAPLNKSKGFNEKPAGPGPGPGKDSDPSTWVMWRVVNANYRVGDAAAAKRLAAIASRTDLPADVRGEALHDLSEWAKPGVRDRITNLARPLANRDDKPAREAAKGVVDALAKDKSDEVKVATARLMQKYGLGDPATLAATAKDAKAPADVRLAAAGTLVEHNDAQVPAVLEALSTDKADAVRRFAIRTRAKAAGGVATAVAVLDGKGPVGDKQAAIDGLGASLDEQAQGPLTAWAEKLVAGQVPPELELEIIEAATASKWNAKLTGLVAKFNAARDPKNPAGEYREALAGGDAKAGGHIFAENAAVSCIRCHSVDGQGGIVGPALDGISLKHPRQYLLESVVAPNAAVAPGFDTALVQVKGAGWKTGVVVSEDDKKLVLRNPEDNALIEIAKADIKARERGPSAMPEGLHKALSKRELRDLVEWLASLKEPAKGANLDHGAPKK